MNDTNAAKHSLHWLPNALTVSRIVLIPVLVWAILKVTHIQAFGSVGYSNAAYIALIIFIYCMATDFLDGYIARKLNLASDFGRMLDPIADKLLVAACLISICIGSLGAFAIVVPSLIIIGRDIFVSGIREHAANSNLILSPTKLAKWKTACEMLAILVYLLSVVLAALIYAEKRRNFEVTETHTHMLDMFDYGFLALLWLAAILSAYTGFHYFRSAMKPR